MIRTETYNLGIKPVQRKDLMDYFPSLAKEFVGYIRQMVFRVTLTDMLSETQGKVIAQMSQVNYDGSLNPLLRDSTYEEEAQRRKREAYFILFRETLADLIEKTNWVLRNKEHDYAEDLRQMSNEYLKAAGKAVTVDVAANIVKGKIAGTMAKPLKKVAGKNLSRNIASGKISPNRAEMNVQFAKTHKIHFDGWYKPLWEANSMDYAIGKAVDEYGSGYMQLGDEMTNNSISKLTPKGYNSSFDNDFTRKVAVFNQEMCRKIGMATFNPVLYAASFIPASTQTKVLDEVLSLSWHVGIAKTVVNVGMNLGLSWVYNSTAERVQAMQDENEERWQHLLEKIKKCIKTDINSLSDGELLGLCKLLEIQ